MMDKDKLRKADLFSGVLIVLLGLFIISQAVKMPMKDSWGGVMNVWYVSPALFPLFVGAMLAFLGGSLVLIAFGNVGKQGFREVIGFLTGEKCISFLRQPESLRFYAIVFNLLVFVFVMIPHIDFFLAAILFLLVLFCMFYFGDHAHMKRVFRFSVFTGLLLSLFQFSPLGSTISKFSNSAGDWLVVVIICIFVLFIRKEGMAQPEQKKKFHLCIIIAVVAPLLIGIIFKYFLLVPLPHEGLIIRLLDSIFYSDLWS
ncbi:MAG: hypothetical protein KJ630_15010 [Proteobacteria bacterium]|nr:hypothetical protein [Pseudomonadota bacterium]